jgi:hypothetical protein
MMRKNSQKMALCGLLTALASVCMLLGAVLPGALYCAPILAMLCLLPLQEEYGVPAALCAYGAAGALTLLLAPDKELALVFLFFGWYPALQPRLDRLRPRWLGWVLTLLILNGAAAALWALVLFVLRLDEAAGLNSPWLWAALLALENGVFALSGRVLRRMRRLWHVRLRRLLLRNR